MEQVIKDKAPHPAGLVPKNLQAFLVVGLALLMVIIMAVTGHKRPNPAETGGAAASLPTLVPVNSQKITDFQKDIEQTQRESAPQVEATLLQQQRQFAPPGTRPVQPFPSNPYRTPVTSDDLGGTNSRGAYPTTLPQSGETPDPPDPIKNEQKKRAYLSLFSDNVALTYRKELRSQNASPGPGANPEPAAWAFAAPGIPDPLPAQGPRGAQADTELAREGRWLAAAQQAGLVSQKPFMAAAQASPKPGLPAMASGQNQAEWVPSEPGGEVPAVPAAHQDKEYVVFEGTVLEALLINRLDGSFAGPVNCLLSNSVYSHDRQHLLIPAGSKIVGEASKINTLGQARLAVAFHRLIMPDGYAANLDLFKGLDQEGTTALKDKVNNHYARIFGASVAIGMLGGVAQLGTGSVLTSGATDRIREGFGAGMASAGEHILDRFLNILPTVTIREGTRVKIYLSNDVLLPDYTTHTMPSNL
jgi:type IV secretory pathway VirB10-like protein